MARLKHPTVGTVVTLEGDLEGSYRASGWVDADSEPEKPVKRSPGRPAKKSESDDK